MHGMAWHDTAPNIGTGININHHVGHVTLESVHTPRSTTPARSTTRHDTKQLRTVSSGSDPIQSLFEWFKDIDHLCTAQDVALMKGHLPLENLRNRDGFVDGASHGFEDDLVRVVCLSHTCSTCMPCTRIGSRSYSFRPRHTHTHTHTHTHRIPLDCIATDEKWYALNDCVVSYRIVSYRIALYCVGKRDKKGKLA